MWLEIILTILALIGYIYWRRQKSKDFWYQRGVPNTHEPIEGDGKTASVHDVSLRLYNQFKNVPFFGSWTFLGHPCLVITNDFDLIKSIFIKDFDHFSISNHTVPITKATWSATRHEKLVINHIGSAAEDEWKNLR